MELLFHDFCLMFKSLLLPILLLLLFKDILFEGRQELTTSKLL